MPEFQIELIAHVEIPAHILKATRRAACRALESLPLPVQDQFFHPKRNTLSLSFISAARMRALNRKYRGKDRTTDVLSFPNPFPKQGYLGEVLLSWTRAKTQATDFENSPLEEVQRLAVHGILHLMGYDHETNAKEARRMFRLQEEICYSLKASKG